MAAAPYLLAGCLYAAGCVVLHAAALAYARRRRLYDQPGERRSHAVPTPRGGGVGIVAAVLPVLLGLAGGRPALAPVVLPLALALLLVGGVGWWDDHRPLPALFRLAVHGLAAALVAFALHAHGASWAWSLLALVVVPVGINVWNFMDGINGLVTSQVVLAAAWLGWAAGGGLVVPAAAVAIAALTFLPFNFPKARIFLGDVGSGSVGLMVAVLWLFAGVGGTFGGCLVLVWPLLPLLVDSLFTIAWRVSKRHHLFTPHAEHVYQRAVRAGLAHATVTGLYAAVTALLVVLAVCALRLPGEEAVTASFLVFLGCVSTWMIARRSTQGVHSPPG